MTRLNSYENNIHCILCDMENEKCFSIPSLKQMVIFLFLKIFEFSSTWKPLLPGSSSTRVPILQIASKIVAQAAPVVPLNKPTLRISRGLK